MKNFAIVVCMLVLFTGCINYKLTVEKPKSASWTGIVSEVQTFQDMTFVSLRKTKGGPASEWAISPDVLQEGDVVQVYEGDVTARREYADTFWIARKSQPEVTE